MGIVRPGEEPAVLPDYNVKHADWTKRTRGHPHIRAVGTTVKEYKRLPVYRWNVDKIPFLRGWKAVA